MKKIDNPKTNFYKKARLSQMHFFQLEEDTENYEIWKNRDSTPFILLERLIPFL